MNEIADGNITLTYSSLLNKKCDLATFFKMNKEKYTIGQYEISQKTNRSTVMHEKIRKSPVENIQEEENSFNRFNNL